MTLPAEPAPTVPAAAPAIRPPTSPEPQGLSTDGPDDAASMPAELAAPLGDASGLSTGAGNLGGLGGIAGGIGGVVGSIVDSIGSILGSLAGGLGDGSGSGDSLADDARPMTPWTWMTPTSRKTQTPTIRLSRSASTTPPQPNSPPIRSPKIHRRQAIPWPNRSGSNSIRRHPLRHRLISPHRLPRRKLMDRRRVRSPRMNYLKQGSDANAQPLSRATNFSSGLRGAASSPMGRVLGSCTSGSAKSRYVLSPLSAYSR